MPKRPREPWLLICLWLLVALFAIIGLVGLMSKG